jgi:hypothetical protein
MDGDDDVLGDDFDDLGEEPSWELPAESRAVLVESLQSPDPDVRREAVEMLAHSLDDALAARALEMARSDPDEEIRAAAANVLAPGLAAAHAAAGGEGPPSPLSPAGVARVEQGLRQLYFDPESPRDVRRRALEAAVQVPETWQEGATRAAWASPDPDWRTTAVFCMARLPGFSGAVVEALRDRESRVRLEAARAAGDGGVREAAPRLLTLAQAADEEGLVRMAAMESLGLLGDRQALGPLRELATSVDPELAFAARSALARIAGGVAEEAEIDDEY